MKARQVVREGCQGSQPDHLSYQHEQTMRRRKRQRFGRDVTWTWGPITGVVVLRYRRYSVILGDDESVHTTRVICHVGVEEKYAYAKSPCVPQTASNSTLTRWLHPRSPRRKNTPVFFWLGHVVGPNGTAALEGASVSPLLTTSWGGIPPLNYHIHVLRSAFPPPPKKMTGSVPPFGSLRQHQNVAYRRHLAGEQLEQTNGKTTRIVASTLDSFYLGRNKRHDKFAIRRIETPSKQFFGLLSAVEDIARTRNTRVHRYHRWSVASHCWRRVYDYLAVCSQFQPGHSTDLRHPGATSGILERE